MANVENGRSAPSARLWSGIANAFPHWVEQLDAAYRAARATVDAREQAGPEEEPFLGGPFELLSVSYAYLFEESRSPHEIIEVRRVRATESGAAAYGLSLTHTEAAGFVVDQQVLWGGTIASTTSRDDAGESMRWTRVEFGKSLRAGQQHEFAVRTWIERDPDPQTEICFSMSIPVREASIHVAFHGTPQPSRVWSYGPIPNEAAIPKFSAGGKRLKVIGGNTSLVVRKPEIEQVYGLAWNWQ